METPAMATKTQQKRIPSESARERAQEYSSADTMVTDPTSRKSADQESTTGTVMATSVAAHHTLQIFACGWRKITSYHGLRIHQGKRKCLGNQRQGPRIDYLLPKESSQSNEAQ